MIHAPIRLFVGTRRMICRTLPKALGLMAAIAWIPAPLEAEIQSGFVPSGLLTQEVEQSLPLDPKKVVALDDAAYVIGTGDDGAQILRLEGPDLEITATRSLGMEPGDAILSEDASLLYVIGTAQDGATRLQVLDLALTPVGEMTSTVRLAHPVLSLVQGQRLLAGGLPTSTVEGGLVAVDLSDPSSPTPIPALVPETYNFFGIAGAWLEDVHTPTIFISTALLPTLVAVEVGPKGVTVLAELGFSDGSYEQRPLTVFTRLSSRQCPEDTELTSFLVSSNINQNLFLAIFDPDYRSLDVVSRTESNLRLNAQSAFESFPDSKVLRPTSLLGSSCDMGVVWISDLNALEIEQFAVNPDLKTLEKVGEIPLSNNPGGLAISTTGNTAYVISGQPWAITRYGSGGNEVSGTDSARALQRLLTERGYPVGVIDGRIGDKTLAAIERFQEQNKVSLDLQGDLEGALETLQNTPMQ